MNIVVVGAGVSGLTSALLLAKNPRNNVSIVAKFMPGDYDIEYCSPWAGADYSPFAKRGTPEATWEERSWDPLAKLAEDVPESGVHFQKSFVYNRNKDTTNLFPDFTSLNPWYKDTVRDFRVLSSSELPPGYDSGTSFTTIQINPAIYLPYLLSLCVSNGVTIERAVLTHITQALNLHSSGRKADVIINCTGLGAATLGGVQDRAIKPARGQTVLVRNEADAIVTTSGTDDAEEELLYVMTRTAGGGTILGGSYQLSNPDPHPDPALATRIMTRALHLVPSLTNGNGPKGLDIIRHGVGLRPYRAGGVRVEKEKMELEAGHVWVVHNYGHAGYGYQASYGCGESVLALVDEINGSSGI